MRKFLIGLAVGLMLAISALAFAANPIKLIVNGKEIKSDVPPQIINGRTMVPARFLAEALGAKVEWDPVSSSVIVTGGVYTDGTPTDLPTAQPQNNQPSDGKWVEGFKVNGQKLSKHTMGFVTPDNFFMEENALNIVLQGLGMQSVTHDPNIDVWFNAWYFISLNRTDFKYQYDAEKKNLVIGSDPNALSGIPDGYYTGREIFNVLEKKYPDKKFEAFDPVTNRIQKGFNPETGELYFDNQKYILPKTVVQNRIYFSITPLVETGILTISDLQTIQ